MPPSAAYRAATCHRDLGPDFYDIVQPARFPDHILRYRNQRWAEKVGLGSLTDEEWIDHFGRFTLLPRTSISPSLCAITAISSAATILISATAAASCSRRFGTRRTAGFSISPPKAAGRRHGRATQTAA